MDVLAFVFVLVALLAGLAAGYVLGGRPLAALRAERDEHLARFKSAIVDLERASREREDAKVALARAESERDARDTAFEARLADLKANEAKLLSQFRELGGQVLGEAQAAFLKRADERFAEAGASSAERLKALLQPVEATLKRYEDGLTRVEKDRNDSYGALRATVEQVRLSLGETRVETSKLVNALRSSPKARGRWGEQSLKNVLEQAGLSQFADYQAEVSVTTDEGRLRPDVIVRLPGGRQLIIDAKCSLNAFLDAHDAVDDAVRKTHLKAHLDSVRLHVTQLSGKTYWTQFGDAADYVVMYIPGEHFLTAALEQDDRLWEWAFERRVLLATPTNLVAIARTVASVWRQERLAEEAAEIARLGKELHGRLATMGGHVIKLGRNLEQATGAYNAFVGSLESQVLTQAKRFEALEVADGAKRIEAMPVIDVVPRSPTKLAAAASEDAVGG